MYIFGYIKDQDRAIIRNEEIDTNGGMQATIVVDLALSGYPMFTFYGGRYGKDDLFILLKSFEGWRDIKLKEKEQYGKTTESPGRTI